MMPQNGTGGAPAPRRACKSWTDAPPDRRPAQLLDIDGSVTVRIAAGGGKAAQDLLD